MRLRPLGDNIIIKRMEPEKSTAGGIVLPDSATSNGVQQGRVLAVGEGRRLADGSRRALQVNEGDRVVFRSYAGTNVQLGSDQMLIIREEDVLAVLQ